jgi:hypothetical protein
MLITGPKSGWDNFFKLRCPSYMFHDGDSEEDKEYSFKSKKDAIAYFPSSMDVEYETGNKFLKDLNELDWLKLNTGQAEIHIMALAECIWDAYNESTPKVLKPGEWHIPFKDKIEYNHAKLIGSEYYDPKKETFIQFIDRQAVKVSTAMAARTSYTVVGEEKDIDYEAMIKLHDRLLAQDPPHSSPLEHCARAMNNFEYTSYIKGKLHNPEFQDSEGEVIDYLVGIEASSMGWCNNLKGFISYRYMVDNGKVE